MRMSIKKCLKNLILLLGLFLLYGINIVHASDVKLVSCELSEEYKEWLTLSDEEKKGRMMPAMCDSTALRTDVASSGVKSKIESMFIDDVGVTLPTKYDIRTTNYKVTLKHQGESGSCWAFATTTMMEAYMKKKYGVDFLFSPLHIEYASTRSFTDGTNKFGFNRTLDTGGNYYMSASYLANGLGPVAESELPFTDNIVPTTLSVIQNKEVLVDVDDIYVEYNSLGSACTSNQIKKIKEMVYKNGAVMANSQMVLNSIYYNNTTGASYYNGLPAVNHAITIVGWDDNYSKTNFNSSNRPKNNGAWIVQNSYSDSLGDGGYNYISYEDLSICYGLMSVTSADQVMEDNAYIYDRLGFNTAYGFQSTSGVSYNTGYAMNVFDKSYGVSEELKEITIAAYSEGSYKIYYSTGNGTNKNIDDMLLIGTGTLEYSGYHTHKLEDPVVIPDNVTEFSIVVHYTSNNTYTPIPLSVQDNDKYSYVSVLSKSSYVSYDGTDWIDLASYFNIYCIASIKAYTNDLDYSVKLNNYEVDDNGLVDIGVTSRGVISNKMSIKVYDSNNKEVSPKNVQYTESNNKITDIKITFNDDIKSGKYKVVVYYDDSYVGEMEIVIAGTLYSDVYAIDDSSLIIYVPANVNYSTFTKNLYGSSGVVYSANNTSVNSGTIGTGMTIDSYLIVVKGDVTGDGLITPLDYISVKNHIMGTSLVTGTAYINAADYNSDASISPLDYVEIKNYIMNGA